MAVKKATTQADVTAEAEPSADAKTATVTAPGGTKVTAEAHVVAKLKTRRGFKG